MKDYLLDAALTLRRNYQDLPFDALGNEETARRVNERVTAALQHAAAAFAYLRPADIRPEKRAELRRRRLLGAEGQDAPYGAAFLRADGNVCVETAGADHFAISAYDEEGALSGCLPSARATAAGLEDSGPMARSEQFGFLTASPSDAGTGLRATLTLHLPMTLLRRQTPAAIRAAAQTGATLHPVGNGLFRLENRVTMGADAEELVRRLVQTADRLCEMEENLRQAARGRGDVLVLDAAWRAYGVARYARRLDRAEALRLWSGLALGASMEKMPYGEDAADALYRIATDPLEGGTEETPLQRDVARAERVRALLDGGN